MQKSRRASAAGIAVTLGVLIALLALAAAWAVHLENAKDAFEGASFVDGAEGGTDHA